MAVIWRIKVYIYIYIRLSFIDWSCCSFPTRWSLEVELTWAGACVTAVSLSSGSTSALIVTYAGVFDFFVCSEHWTSTLSHTVCRQLGYSWVLVSDSTRPVGLRWCLSLPRIMMTFLCGSFYDVLQRTLPRFNFPTFHTLINRCSQNFKRCTCSITV